MPRAKTQGIASLVELPAELEPANLILSASADGTLALWDVYRGTTPSRPNSSAATVRSPRSSAQEQARLLDKVNGSGGDVVRCAVACCGVV